MDSACLSGSILTATGAARTSRPRVRGAARIRPPRTLDREPQDAVERGEVRAILAAQVQMAGEPRSPSGVGVGLARWNVGDTRAVTRRVGRGGEALCQRPSEPIELGHRAEMEDPVDRRE